MRKGLVSVITPVYNAEKYLKQQIECILSQTYTNIEFILINDASIDASEDIIKQYNDDRISYLKNEKNMGIEYTTNKALSICKGDYVIFIDNDDIIPKNRIELQIDFMEKNPEYVMQGGGYGIINESGLLTYLIDNDLKYSSNDMRAMLLFQTPFVNGSVICRMDVIRNNSIVIRNGSCGMQDFRLFTELACFGRISYYPYPLVYHRVHENNQTQKYLSQDGVKRKEIYALIQKESLIRNGFLLSEDEYNLFNYCFQEWDEYGNISLDKIYLVDKLLDKLVEQATHMNKEYVAELVKLCDRKYAKLCRANGIKVEDNTALEFINNRMFSNVKNGLNIVLWGAGQFLEGRIGKKYFDNINVQCIVDNSKEKQNRMLHGVPVVAPEILELYDFDFIVIMTRSSTMIKEQIISLGVASNKILSYIEWIEKCGFTMDYLDV